jgi:dolichol-phosphate mannosyltransferase
VRAAALSIVVPTYNERDRLADLVAGLFGVFERHGVDGEVVVVDDNSPDGTGALADQLATTYRVRVVHRSGKLGLGTAVIEGFSAASAPVVGVMDGDLSHPPDRLPQMLSLLHSTGADMIVGSRYIPGGGTTGWPMGRLILSRLACALARPVTRVVDATSGFFLVRRDSVSDVAIEAGGFKICLELLVRGQIRTVAEVPYVFAGRTAGQSKMNVAEALGYLRQLRLLWIHARRHRLPDYRRITPDEVRLLAAPLQP